MWGGSRFTDSPESISSLRAGDRAAGLTSRRPTHVYREPRTETRDLKTNGGTMMIGHVSIRVPQTRRSRRLYTGTETKGSVSGFRAGVGNRQTAEGGKLDRQYI